MKAIVTLLFVAALLAFGATQAFAHRTAPAGKIVVVAMHDPGCHWFTSNGKFLKSLNVAGPVKLLNIDEATLLVKSTSGVKHDGVGKLLALTPGVYHITMVGQAPDDNHLTLVVR